MARSTMADIIAFVRELINDPAGVDQQYTDDQIQMRLDLGRLDMYQLPLIPRDSLSVTGEIEYLDFYSGFKFWEDDYVLQKYSGPLGTPDVAEPLLGHWHWNTSQEDSYIITGKIYNVYGAASTLLTNWIATIRSEILSWTADGTTIQRSRQLSSMTALAAQYADMAFGWGGGRANQIKLVRKDLRN